MFWVDLLHHPEQTIIILQKLLLPIPEFATLITSLPPKFKSWLVPNTVTIPSEFPVFHLPMFYQKIAHQHQHLFSSVFAEVGGRGPSPQPSADWHRRDLATLGLREGFRFTGIRAEGGRRRRSISERNRTRERGMNSNWAG
jgi:hypothetical protein